MRVTKQVKVTDVNEKEFSVTVKELTVAEVRSWLVGGDRAKAMDLSQNEDDFTISNLIFSDFTLFDFEIMSDGITISEMIDCVPSELEKIMTVAKAVNPDFFRIITSLYEMGVDQEN